MAENKQNGGKVCDFKCGPLPDCAPLATAYVPTQQEVTPKYDAGEALVRGTLFPGLDLPFMNMVNVAAPDVPTAELMALDFVLDELNLYLDTHKDDTEAFALYQQFLSLAKEGRKRYVALYGPITQSDLATAKSYTWLKAPWPWEYSERTGD